MVRMLGFDQQQKRLERVFDHVERDSKLRDSFADRRHLRVVGCESWSHLTGVLDGVTACPHDMERCEQKPYLIHEYVERDYAKDEARLSLYEVE